MVSIFSILMLLFWRLSQSLRVRKYPTNGTNGSIIELMVNFCKGIYALWLTIITNGLSSYPKRERS